MAYGDPVINEIIEAFTQHMGMEPTPKQSQRRYASTLKKQFGDVVTDLVKYAISIQSDYYAPRITSPKDLYYKSSRVVDYYKRNEDSGRVLKI